MDVFRNFTYFSARVNAWELCWRLRIIRHHHIIIINREYLHGHLRVNLYQLMDHHEIISQSILDLVFNATATFFFKNYFFGSSPQSEKIIFKVVVQDDSSNVRMDHFRSHFRFNSSNQNYALRCHLSWCHFYQHVT